MKNGIESKQGVSLLVLFLVGSTMVAENAHAAKQDAWLALLLAFAALLPCLAVYTRLHALFPGHSLYDIARSLWGRAGGGVLALLYALFFLHAGCLSVTVITGFVKLNLLPSTPTVAVALPLCLLAAWFGSLGLPRMGKGAVILLMIVVLDIALTIIFSVSFIDFRNLLPVLNGRRDAVLDEALTAFSAPMTQLAVFLCVFGPSGKKLTRVYFVGASAGAALLLVNLLRAVTVLGGEAMGKLYYATYLSTGVLRVSSFVQRVEVLLSNAFLACLLIQLGVFFYAAYKAVLCLIPPCKPLYFYLPVALAAAILSPYLFVSAAEAMAWMRVYRVYAPVMQVAVPLLLWIWGEIAVKIRRRRAAGTAFSPPVS